MTPYQLARVCVMVFQQSPITPYRTGNLKFANIYATKISETESLVTIGGNGRGGGNGAPYAINLEYDDRTKFGNPNRHKGFVEKVMQEFINYLQANADNIEKAEFYKTIKVKTKIPPSKE